MELFAVPEKTAKRKARPDRPSSPLADTRVGKMSAETKAASMKLIHVHGQPLGDGTSPLICTPLVGRTREAILGELAIILAKKPDLIEWRVDFFEGIGNTPLVIELAGNIKQAAGAIPIIFTRRSMNEGGECIALDEDDVVKLYVAACASGCVDIIDYELSNPAENLARLRNTSRDNDVAMIMSYHNFQSTPDAAALTAKFMEAARQGADIAKVAVMPRIPEDVLTLLGATLQASESCGIPVIGMAMGGLGSLSRMVGGVYGSAVTFAVGKSSSAPGQVSIEDLRTVLALVRQAVAGRQDAWPGQ
jgi:3-dehydroquinate dehydratase-1